MRRQHFVKWLKSKGDSIALRLFTRSGRKNESDPEFTAIMLESSSHSHSDWNEAHSEFSLENILCNPELSSMLHSYAETKGSAAHVEVQISASPGCRALQHPKLQYQAESQHTTHSPSSRRRVSTPPVAPAVDGESAQHLKLQQWAASPLRLSHA